jgi:hypothetical protein
MDDSQYGIRDRRGHWRPFKPLGYPPLFVWPAQPKALAKWLFGHDGYMLPWNLFYASIAVVLLALSHAIDGDNEDADIRLANILAGS